MWLAVPSGEGQLLLLHLPSRLMSASACRLSVPFPGQSFFALVHLLQSFGYSHLIFVSPTSLILPGAGGLPVVCPGGGALLGCWYARVKVPETRGRSMDVIEQEMCK